MKNKLKILTKTPVITTLLIAFLFLTWAFKSSDDQKKILTIQLINDRSGAKLYVFDEGVNTESIKVPFFSGPLEDRLEYSATLNKTLNKYYKAGWTLVSFTETTCMLSK